MSPCHVPSLLVSVSRVLHYCSTLLQCAVLVFCCVQTDNIWHDVFSELEACGHLCRNAQTPGQFIVCHQFVSCFIKSLLAVSSDDASCLLAALSVLITLSLRPIGEYDTIR